jgi:hypothetical protein
MRPGEASILTPFCGERTVVGDRPAAVIGDRRVVGNFGCGQEIRVYRRKAIASTPELANSFSNPFGRQPLGFESFPVGFSCMHRRISTVRMVAELGSRETSR